MYFENMSEILGTYDIFLGSVAGSIIQLNIGKNNKKTAHLRNDENCEITSLAWGRTHEEMLIGYKKGHVKIYNLAFEASSRISSVADSSVMGIVPFEEDLIFATNNGNIYHWTNGRTKLFLKNHEEWKSIEKIVSSPFDQNILGVGGINNDLKLFDITTQKTVFEGKSDRHDELELAQPISINNMAFFTNTSNINNIGTVTKQGQIRIYDTRAQRRPIKIFKNTDSVYTTISATNIDNEVCVGSNKGYLQVMDLRNQIKPVKTFKGFMGGLTDIFCDLNVPIVASCCLDRYFRVHNLQEKKLEFEEYVKIQTPCMLMRTKSFLMPVDADAKEIKTEKIEAEDFETTQQDETETEVIKVENKRLKQQTKQSKKLKTSQ